MASELTLSLLVGLGLDPAPRIVMESLTDVSVNIGAGGSSPSGFELKFATSKSSPITTHLLPSGYFDPPTRVVISAALRGVTTVLMDGVITQQDVVPSDEAGKSVLSIKGEDLTRMMDVVDFGGLIPYPAMPDFARVALIVAKYIPIYQTIPLVIPSILFDINNPLDAIPWQSGTDLEYINMLAERVGYTFYLQPGPMPGMSIAYWGPKLQANIPFLPTPTPFAIDWDGRSNVESLQFSFDGFKKTVFVVLIQVPDVPVPIPIPIPDVNPLSPPLGEKNPVPLKVKPLTGLSGYSPIEAAVIALAKTADAANVISGQGTLDVLRYGSILSPRTVVEVKGAGITYDGEYYVQTVTHTIKPGSYKQSFTLVRNRLIPSGSAFSADLFGGQQLPAFATAAPVSAAPPGTPVAPPPAPMPPLPGPGPAVPVPLPGGPVVPAVGGGAVVSSLPGSPTG
ncbi:MAG: hypothetical protein JOZ95_12905 [Solirubrobacterales bacterium]|nr:hypothetical protein [Solirubrobacterales bacterium]MBV9365347.1 hypothetical protein [Solirubrobacterales bacterium]